MATTVPIDDDLLAPLKQAAEESGLSLAAAVNATLREKLAGGPAAANSQPRMPPALSLGEPVIDINKAWEFLGDEDTERFRQISDQHEAD